MEIAYGYLLCRIMKSWRAKVFAEFFAMASAGNARNQVELRRKPRRQFHYHARILTEGDKLFACAISDISETGARLQLVDERKLPERFILLLTPNGDARRHCRLVWRNGLFVGVEFPNAQV
jgi:hypothetical protein